MVSWLSDGMNQSRSVTFSRRIALSQRTWVKEWLRKRAMRHLGLCQVPRLLLSGAMLLLTRRARRRPRAWRVCLHAPAMSLLTRRIILTRRIRYGMRSSYVLRITRHTGLRYMSNVSFPYSVAAVIEDATGDGCV